MNFYKELSDAVWLATQAQTKTQEQIAKELGCSRSAVIRAYQKKGIAFPKKYSHESHAPNYVLYPQLQDAEWLRAQLITKNPRQVAEEIGCSRGAVQEAIQNRLPDFERPSHRPKEQAALRRFPQLHDAEWLKAQISEKSLHRVAQEVGCSYGGVINAMRKYGIEAPGRTKPRVFRDTDARANARKAVAAREPGFGQDAPRWGGGRVQVGKRYIGIYAPEHPRADGRGYVLEHLLVMEKVVGRPILPSERVHHKNNDGEDNRPENLELYTDQRAHFQRHFNAVGRERSLEQENEALKARIAELEAQLSPQRPGGN